jgi:hypothetical protein
MKPNRHSGGTRPDTGALPGKSEVWGMKTGHQLVFPGSGGHASRWSAAEAKPVALPLDFGWYKSKVCDGPESSSFTQGGQSIRISC